MGERTPLAVGKRGGRLPRRDRRRLLNLARHHRRFHNVEAAANWMAACGQPGQDAALYAAVQDGRVVMSGAWEGIATFRSARTRGSMAHEVVA